MQRVKLCVCSLQFVYEGIPFMNEEEERQLKDFFVNPPFWEQNDQ